MRTRAAVLYSVGHAGPFAETLPLKIEDVEIDGPGEGEVLVEVVAAGVCHSDLSVIDGSRPRVMPMVLGHEASGIVREVGAGVRDFSSGDHVVFSYVPVCGRCDYCSGGRASLCSKGAAANGAGTLLNGGRRFINPGGGHFHHHLGVSGFSQFTVAARESLVKIDTAFPLEKAALFGCAVLTGVGAVVNTARVEAGSSAAVFGLGGVGLSAVMGARAAGASVIAAVDVVAEKLELAKRIGATHTVLAGEGVDVVKQVREAAGGGVAYCFDTTGHVGALMQAYESTARGGTTIAIGLPHPSKVMPIPAALLVAEERTIKGSYMGSCVPRRDVPRFMGMHAAGLLPVDLLWSHTVRLEEINTAMDRLARGEAVRQIVTFS